MHVDSAETVRGVGYLNVTDLNKVNNTNQSFTFSIDCPCKEYIIFNYFLFKRSVWIAQFL